MMFRKTGITVCLMLCMGAALGQSFKFGVLFDPTLTWLRSDVSDVTPAGTHAGFDLGMSVDYYFTDNYALSSGISLFSTGGTLRYGREFAFHTKEKGVSVPVAAGSNVKYMSRYVKIPLSLKLKTHMIGRTVYWAGAGLDQMIRTGAKADIPGAGSVKANREVKGFNMGWHFGFGVEYSLGGDAAVYTGLSFMNTFFDITAPSHDRITSNHLALRMGMTF